MSDTDGIWRGKSDDQVADAAKHLSDYTEEGERIIRRELRRRGMAEPPRTERPIDEMTSPVVHRYRDAYRVGAALVALGTAIKIIGAILGAIIVIGSLSSANTQFGGDTVAVGGLMAVVGGLFMAVVIGGLFWICGVVVAAQGQLLRATLDTAVASSHFLTDIERADAMGLPHSVAGRARVRRRTASVPERQAFPVDALDSSVVDDEDGDDRDVAASPSATESAPFCYHCGNEVAGGATTCPACGKQL